MTGASTTESEPSESAGKGNRCHVFVRFARWFVGLVLVATGFGKACGRFGSLESPAAIISYDEKPGIQAISSKAPDLTPVAGKYACIARDYEYKRHGTVSFLAGIDLLSGNVHGLVADRHRSREFIQFLKMLDAHYPEEITIRIILDNHSSHISKETRKFLATVPNRFEFIFTPTHGSWLNIIESLFAKMAKTFLRAIRVDSKEELKQRILKWVDEINVTPVIFRWKYGLDLITTT